MSRSSATSLSNTSKGNAVFELEDSKVHAQLQYHKRLCLKDSEVHASTLHGFLQHLQRICLHILLQHLATLCQLEAMLHLKSQMTFIAVWTLQKVGLGGPKLGMRGRTVLGTMMSLDSFGPNLWTGAYTGNGATTQEV